MGCSKSEALTSLLSEGAGTTDDAAELVTTQHTNSEPPSSTPDDIEGVPSETSDTESDSIPSNTDASSDPSPSEGGSAGDATVPTMASAGQGGAPMGGSAGTISSGNAGESGGAGLGGTPFAGGSGGSGGTAGVGTTLGGTGGAAGTSGSGGSGGVEASPGGGGTGGSAAGGAANGETCVADVVSANPSASSLVSDFSASTGFTINSCSSVSGGQGLAEPGDTPNAGNYCMLKTATKYDLTCGSVVVKVPERTRSTVGAQTFIYVERSLDEVMVLALEGTAFHFFTDGGPSATGSNYDAVQDLWWRIREHVDAGERQVSFETSPDGASWVERARIPRPFPFDAVTITLGAGTYQDVATPGRGAFDCYNSVGACP